MRKSSDGPNCILVAMLFYLIAQQRSVVERDTEKILHWKIQA